MTKEELFPAIVSTAHALSERTPAKTEDKVIGEEELQTYFNNGWQFLSVVNSKHVVVRRTMLANSLDQQTDETRKAGVASHQ